MTSLTIPSEDAQRLWAGEDHSGLMYVDKVFVDEWRWGVTYQLVIQDKLTEKYYSTIVREQSGNHWYLSIEESDETKFNEVERVPVVSYEYRSPGYVE